MIDTYEEQDIYKMEMEYGCPGVKYVRHLDQKLNPHTGKLLTTSMFVDIPRTIVFPVKRNFRQEFGHLPSNMKYDSSYRRQYSNLIYRAWDPTHQPDQADRYIIRDLQWGIDEIMLYQSYYYVAIYSVLESEDIWQMKNEDEITKS